MRGDWVLCAEEGETGRVTGGVELAADDALAEDKKHGDGGLVAKGGERGESKGSGVWGWEELWEENVCETRRAFDGGGWGRRGGRGGG